jgi:hypothetical protein
MAAFAALLLGACVTLALAEVAVRLLRINQFPVFVIGGSELYRMAPNQSGRLYGRIGWRYDRYGMRSDAGLTTLAGATILLGDSVVDGGALADQEDTIMAALGRMIGRKPYPVACHGWSLLNALDALSSLPDWEHTDWLVCVVNAGDFDSRARPASPLSFPTRRPRLLVPWLLRRHFFRRPPRWWPGRRPVPDLQVDLEFRANLVIRFAEMANRFRGRILVVYVPMRPEIMDEAEFCRTLAGAAPGAQMLDVSKSESWGEDCYADYIHPNARGRGELARLIGGYLLAPDQRHAS